MFTQNHPDGERHQLPQKFTYPGKFITNSMKLFCHLFNIIKVFTKIMARCFIPGKALLLSVFY